MRRKRCKMCGELTGDPRTVYATAAVAPGVDAPGATPKSWTVCRSCYGLLGGYDDDDA